MFFFIHFIKDVSLKLKEHHVSAFAGQTAYFILLSALPFLMFFLTLIQHLTIEPDSVFDIVRYLVPEIYHASLRQLLYEIQKTTSATPRRAPRWPKRSSRSSRRTPSRLLRKNPFGISNGKPPWQFLIFFESFLALPSPKTTQRPLPLSRSRQKPKNPPRKMSMNRCRSRCRKHLRSCLPSPVSDRVISSTAHPVRTVPFVIKARLSA